MGLALYIRGWFRRMGFGRLRGNPIHTMDIEGRWFILCKTHALTLAHFIVVVRNRTPIKRLSFARPEHRVKQRRRPREEGIDQRFLKDGVVGGVVVGGVVVGVDGIRLIHIGCERGDLLAVSSSPWIGHIGCVCCRWKVVIIVPTHCRGYWRRRDFPSLLLWEVVGGGGGVDELIRLFSSSCESWHSCLATNRNEEKGRMTEE